MHLRKPATRCTGAIVAAILLLAGCGQAGGTAESNSQPGGTQSQSSVKVVIKFGHHLATASVQHQAAQKFAELVSQKTGGAVEVKLFPSASLGGEKELLQQVKAGSLHMALGESGLLANYNPKIGILALPFLFRDYDHYHHVVDGPIGQELSTELQKQAGFRILGWLDGGIRDTYTSKKPINLVADFKGMKIRTPESPMFVKTFSALGASPTPVAANEMYTAIQTGVVAGMEGSVETGWTFKIYEVTKYLSRTRHINTDLEFVVSDSFFQQLKPAYQKAVVEAAKEATEFQRKTWADREADFNQKLTTQGKLQVVQPDLKPFYEAVKPLYEELGKELNAADLVQKISVTK